MPSFAQTYARALNVSLHSWCSISITSETVMRVTVKYVLRFVVVSDVRGYATRWLKNTSRCRLVFSAVTRGWWIVFEVSCKLHTDDGDNVRIDGAR